MTVPRETIARSVVACFSTLMLRKNVTSEASSVRSRDLGNFDHDNDKASKMKRRKDSQTKAIFFCLGIIALLGVIAKVKVNHLHKYTSRRLRKHPHAKAEEEGKVVDTPSAVNFLPPHSLYKLEVEDIYGKMINFSKYQGMVTLIVNVACS